MLLAVGKTFVLEGVPVFRVRDQVHEAGPETVIPRHASQLHDDEAVIGVAARRLHLADCRRGPARPGPGLDVRALRSEMTCMEDAAASAGGGHPGGGTGSHR